MNIQNMLSNLGPKIGNGYRGQLNNDPSIMQGRYFLKAESKYKKSVDKDLSLIESTDSPTLGSLELKEGFGETASSDVTGNQVIKTSNEQLMREFNMNLKLYNDLVQLYGSYNGPLPANITEAQANSVRTQLKNDLVTLSNKMKDLAINLKNNVGNKAGEDYASQGDINKKMDEIRRSIGVIYSEKDDYNQKMDTTTPLAEVESTGLLSKQRYYYYILWIIIAGIVIYITLISMGEGGDSKSIMILGVIIVIIFIVLVGWSYMRGVNLPNLSMYDYDIRNFFQFNPLVRIKYTS